MCEYLINIIWGYPIHYTLYHLVVNKLSVYQDVSWCVRLVVDSLLALSHHRLYMSRDFYMCWRPCNTVNRRVNPPEVWQIYFKTCGAILWPDLWTSNILTLPCCPDIFKPYIEHNCLNNVLHLTVCDLWEVNTHKIVCECYPKPLVYLPLYETLYKKIDHL